MDDYDGWEEGKKLQLMTMCEITLTQGCIPY